MAMVGVGHIAAYRLGPTLTPVLSSRDLRIGNFRSNQITNRIGGCDSNSNQIRV